MSERIRLGITADTSAFSRQLNSSIDDAGRRIKNTFTVNSRNFTRPLGKITGSVDEFDKSMEAANARVLAFGASTGVLLAFQKAMRGVARATIEVEKELKDINVVLNLNNKDLNNFKKSLFEVARSTGQTFETVAEGAKELSRQGLGTSETLSRISNAMILSRLSGLGAQESVEALTAALNSYTKSAITATEVVNTLANVDAAFAVSSADLAEGIKRVGSSAEDASVNIKELTALITATQQITARGGSVIGNAFKTIFTRLSRPQVLDDLEKLGVQVRTTSGETLSAVRVLENYVGVYDTLSPALKSSTDEMIGSVFQINQLKAIIKDISNETGIYRRALAIANEETTQAIDRNQELNTTLDARIKALKAAGLNLGSQLGDGILDGDLGDVLDNFTDVIDKTAGAIGSDFGKKILQGLGDFITGPGAFILGAVVINLVRTFSSFAISAISRLTHIKDLSRDQILINKNINAVVNSRGDILDAIINKTRSYKTLQEEIFQEIKDSNIALQRRESFVQNTGAVFADKLTANSRGNLQEKPQRKTRFFSNLAPSPLAQAIEREKKDANVSRAQIRVGRDPRLISPDNPFGMGVYNTKDEPLGLGQGIERELALGNDPRKSGLTKRGKIPTFADDGPLDSFLDKAGSSKKGNLSRSISTVGNNVALFEVSVAGLIDELLDGKINFDKFNKTVNKSAKMLGVTSEQLNNTYKEHKDLFTQLSKDSSKVQDQHLEAFARDSQALGIMTAEREEEIRDNINSNNKKKRLTLEEINTLSANKRDIPKLRDQAIKNLEKGPFIGGFKNISIDNKLKKINTEESLAVRKDISSKFRESSQSRALGLAIGTSFAAPFLSELSQTFISDRDSQAAQIADSVTQGFARAASIGSVATQFGGPVTGLAIGGLVLSGGLVKSFLDLNDAVPKLTKSLLKAAEASTKLNDLATNIASVNQKLSTTTDPKERVELQKQKIEFTSQALREGLKIGENGEITNLKATIDKATQGENSDRFAKALLEFSKKPEDTTLAQTFFEVIKKTETKNGKSLINEFASGNSFEKEIEKFTNAAKKSEEKLRKVNEAIKKSAFGSSAGAAGFEAGVNRVKANEGRVLIRDIFGEDFAKEISNKGDKGVLEFVNILQAYSKAVKESSDELSSSNIQLKNLQAATNTLNTSVRELSRSVSILNALSQADIDNLKSVSNLRDSLFKQSISTAGLTTRPETIRELDSRRSLSKIQDDFNISLATNFNKQRETTAGALNSLIKTFQADDFDDVGKNAINNLSNIFQDFVTKTDSKNFDADLGNLESNILNIVKNSGPRFSGDKTIKLLEDTVDELRNANFQRKTADQKAEADRKISENLERAQLSLNRKRDKIQERINFGGSISDIVSGDRSQRLLNATGSITQGTPQQSLQGFFDLAKELQSFGVVEPFKDELVSGIAEQLRRDTSNIGLQFTEDQLRQIAETKFNAEFKKSNIEELSNAIKNFQASFSQNINNTFQTLKSSIDVLSKNLTNEFPKQLTQAIREANSSGGGFVNAIKGVASGTVNNLKPLIEGVSDFIKNDSNLQAALRAYSVPLNENGIPITIARSKNTSKVGDSNINNSSPDTIGDYNDELKDTLSTLDSLLTPQQIYNNNLIELEKQSQSAINTNRINASLNRELASAVAQLNAEERKKLVRYNSLSGGEAFADNLFDTLNSNRLDYESQLSEFGVELGSEIKTSFKGAIGSMVRDISSFEDAAKQAFQSILNRITDYGVSQFVDQGLGAITRSVKGFNSGGLVTGGSGVKDDVPANLMSGEYVIRKSVVDKVGLGFLEGLNSSTGNASTTLQNAFNVNKKYPRSVADGNLNVDPNLSVFALTDDNNPQNQNRLDTESQFIQYLKDLQSYEADVARAMAAYRKEKKNILTQGFLSAFLTIGASGLSSLGSNNQIGPRLEDGSFNPSSSVPPLLRRIGTFAKGGFTKDNIPALVQGGEFIMNKDAVDRLGIKNIEALNAGRISPRRFATGGAVSNHNTNFIQSVGEKPVVDVNFEPLMESINKLAESTSKDSSKTSQSSGAMTNTFSFHINIEKDGNASVDQKSQTQENDKMTQFADMMKSVVLETIIQQKEAGGLLSPI